MVPQWSYVPLIVGQCSGVHHGPYDEVCPRKVIWKAINYVRIFLRCLFDMIDNISGLQNDCFSI